MREIACALTACSLLALGACGEAAPPHSQVRPVRTVTVHHRVISEPVALSGHIRAQEEVSHAFRIDGKLIERPVAVGDEVAVGQLLARLDPQNEQNALRSAEADVGAAQASLTQAQRTEARQRDLLSKGYTTRTQYEQSQQQLQTAQAQLDSAQARLRSAQDRVAYTELRAEAVGTVIAKGAEPGEVVRAGQMIVQVAREGRKDAVFDVPAQLMFLQGVPANPVVEIVLADNPAIKAEGRIRQIAPQADRTTRTFPVRIALVDPPDSMRLGATVKGGISLSSPPILEVPATALTDSGGSPAVWVVEPQKQTVGLRPVKVMRYDGSGVIISQGLEDGEIVVTAGVQVLRPGQKVRLLGGSS